MPLLRPVTVVLVVVLPVVDQVAPLSLLYSHPVANNTLPQESSTCRSPARAVSVAGAAGKMGAVGISCATLPVIVTVFDTGLPAVTPDGKLAVFTATVKVSSSPSLSRVVEIVPELLRLPPLMVMPDNVPWSPSSEVPRVTVNGMVTAADRAWDNVAVTITAVPSGTTLGDVDSVTVALVVSGALRPLTAVPLMAVIFP